jgi:hypothetical protein
MFDDFAQKRKSQTCKQKTQKGNKKPKGGKKQNKKDQKPVFVNDQHAHRMDSEEHDLPSTPTTPRQPAPTQPAAAHLDRIDAIKTEMEQLKRGFQKQGVPDIFAFDELHVRTRRLQQVEELGLLTQSGVKEYTHTRTRRIKAMLEQAPFTAQRWVASIYEHDPPDHFLEDESKRLAYWRASCNDEKVLYLESFLQQQCRTQLATAQIAAERHWQRKWANHITRAFFLKTELDELTVCADSVDIVMQLATDCTKKLKKTNTLKRTRAVLEDEDFSCA